MSEGGNSSQKIKKMIKVIVGFEILCLFLGFGLGIISSVVDFSDLCFKRYAFDGLNGSGTMAEANVSIRADANYSTTIVDQGDSDSIATEYNQWKKLNFRILPGKSLTIKARGVMSLCRSYLPLYHLQDVTLPGRSSDSIYYTRSNGAKIPIPRADESAEPLTLIFSAKARGWRNLAEVYNGDIVKVILKDNTSPLQSSSVDLESTAVTEAECDSIVDESSRQACLSALSLFERRERTISDCDTISDPIAKASCVRQFEDIAPISALTEDDCRSMEASMVQTCLDSIRSSAPTVPERLSAPSSATPISINVAAISVTDSITGIPTIADCRQGKRIYSPICGRYSLWDGTTSYYPRANCTCHSNGDENEQITNARCQKYTCGSRCTRRMLYNVFSRSWECPNPRRNRVPIYCYKDCFTCTALAIPEAYRDDGHFTKSRFTNPNAFLRDWGSNPQGFTDRCELSYTPLTKFWFSAQDAAGLQYRFHTNVYPGSSRALGSRYNWARIINPDSDIYKDEYTPRKIYSDNFSASNVAYMQFRFHGAGYSTTQTGGYVLQLLHTKCRRENGEYFGDSLEDRGAVEYLILPSGNDPNSDPTLAANPGKLDFTDGVLNFDTGQDEGYMWLKVKNNIEDYPDSIGSYRISIGGIVNHGSFTLQILNPLFKLLREKVYDLALGTFEKMTCYKTRPTDSCINFFNYIKAILMLYIMILGFRFLLGADIKHEELIKSLIKVVILIGLMNGGTFEFFREYLYPIITGFSDQIISNMSGFSMLSSSNSVENPFMFADALLSKMFLNPTFLFQLLTTMAMGITGLLYFMIICVGVVIFAIAIFRAMAVYIMAMLATALLIGVAPIFISFLLFERTYYLFENWVKFTFKYMMEPVIVMAGIIILTQLFTLYIDQVLSFSLCWKCTLPFKLPFASLLPFPGLANIPLFCIYWFSPWGLDPVNDPMGINLAMVVGLAMVSYSAYGYIEFAAKIATRLLGGGASSVDLGRQMAADLGGKISDVGTYLQDAIAKAKEKNAGKGKDDDSGDSRRPTIGKPSSDGEGTPDSSALKPKPSISSDTNSSDKGDKSSISKPKDTNTSSKPTSSQGISRNVEDAQRVTSKDTDVKTATKTEASPAMRGGVEGWGVLPAESKDAQPGKPHDIKAESDSASKVPGDQRDIQDQGDQTGQVQTEQPQNDVRVESQAQKDLGDKVSIATGLGEVAEEEGPVHPDAQPEGAKGSEVQQQEKEMSSEQVAEPTQGDQQGPVKRKDQAERADIATEEGITKKGLFSSEVVDQMDDATKSAHLKDLFGEQFGKELSPDEIDKLVESLDVKEQGTILENGIENAKDINDQLKAKLPGNAKMHSK